MLRTSLIAPLACLLLLRETLCARHDGPCMYEESPLAADDATPWGTTPAEDIVSLELPRDGVWRWGESSQHLDIPDSGVELPATASFVHEPGAIRYREHVSGGGQVACDGPTVLIGGTLTFTDEQDEIILSVPVTAERQDTANPAYFASPFYAPVSSFPVDLVEKAEWESSGVSATIAWVNETRLWADFTYGTQNMTSETTGGGIFTAVADFDAEGHQH